MKSAPTRRHFLRGAGVALALPWLESLAPSGWIGGDDYEAEYPGVIRAVRERFGEPGLDFEVRNDQDWGTWLCRNPKAIR